MPPPGRAHYGLHWHKTPCPDKTKVCLLECRCALRRCAEPHGRAAAFHMHVPCRSASWHARNLPYAIPSSSARGRRRYSSVSCAATLSCTAVTSMPEACHTKASRVSSRSGGHGGCLLTPRQPALVRSWPANSRGARSGVMSHSRVLKRHQGSAATQGCSGVH